MKFRLIAMWIALFVVIGVGRVTSAQDETKKTNHQKVRTLTGCLQKAESDPNEYQLTTKAGDTPGKSRAMPLKWHRTSDTPLP